MYICQMRKGKPGCWFVACVTAVLMASCSSSSSTGARPTTTSRPKSTTSTVAGGIAEARAAEDEAAKILRALHDRQPEFCVTPNFERNISLPPEQHVPIPVTRASCIYSTFGLIQVVAFALPGDRTKYMANWTARLCHLSNKNGRRGLNATFWVVNDRSVTLTPTLDGAQAVASIAGGQVHQETCPPSA